MRGEAFLVLAFLNTFWAMQKVFAPPARGEGKVSPRLLKCPLMTFLPEGQFCFGKKPVRFIQKTVLLAFISTGLADRCDVLHLYQLSESILSAYSCPAGTLAGHQCSTTGYQRPAPAIILSAPYLYTSPRPGSGSSPRDPVLPIH